MVRSIAIERAKFKYRARTKSLRGKKERKNYLSSVESNFQSSLINTSRKVKVCIVGQDPYHTKGAANGLAFSINKRNPLQLSLINIYKELNKDLGISKPTHGDLIKWAEQGVLLLNTTLTVYEHQPNSHLNWGWKNFTKAVLQTAHALPQPVIFILWGANAQDLLKDLITCAAIYQDRGRVVMKKFVKKAFILSSHPSPPSCGKPYRSSPPLKSVGHFQL